MRLLTKVRRIERETLALAAALEAADAKRRPVAVLWHDTEAKLSAEEVAALGPGDEIVRDFWIESKAEGSTTARCRERVTRDPLDLGRVYNAGGDEIGRVVRDDGHVVTLDYEWSDDAGDGAARGAS